MSNFPHFPHIFLWIIGSILVAVSGLFLMKRTCKWIRLGDNIEFLNATVATVGALVSVVLGLLVSSSVDQFRDIESNVKCEAGDVGDIYRLARALPADSQSKLQESCIDYCKLMVTQGWPAMQKGHDSEILTAAYARISDQIFSLQKAATVSDNILSALIDADQRLAENRRCRIGYVTGTWTWKFLPVIVLCSILLLALSYVYVDEKPSKTQIFLVSFVAVALGSNIGFLVVMSRPFDDFGVSPEIFNIAAAKMVEHRTTSGLFAKP